MSTPSQIAAQAARTRRSLYIVAGAVVLALVLALGWFLGRSQTAPSGAPGAPSASSSTPTQSGEGFTPLAGQGLADNRFRVRFAHSPKGAASAAIAYLRALGTNDAQVLTKVFNVYEDRDTTPTEVKSGFLPVRAREIQDTRPQGTVFDTEAFPHADAYYSITPIGVWWEKLDAGTVRVRVLADEDISDGASLTFQRTYIHGRTLEWDDSLRGGDWVVSTDYEDPSDEAYAAFDADAYHLDHPKWTPIASPEGEGG